MRVRPWPLCVCVFVLRFLDITLAPPMSSPPPCPSPPPGGGPSLPSSKKNVLLPYCTALCHRDTSLSGIMVTSFVLTPCTPQTSENVPSRRCCALCPFHKGACAGCWGTPLGTSCISPGTSRRQSGSPKSWKLQQLLNLHRNLQPNVESRLQQSLLQPVHPSLSLMGNMCSCSRLCGTVRGSFTLSLCRTRGMHRTDEWMLCIENSAYLYCVHGMTGHEFCRVCAGKWFVGSGVHPPGGWGGVIW